MPIVQSPLQRSTSQKFNKVATSAMSSKSDKGDAAGLAIDLRGKRAFIAGVADDNGYGWAIAKALAAAAAEILIGCSDMVVGQLLCGRTPIFKCLF
ncbi:uncharacterized protein A4U43_C04F24830 [Asparagus officinalis]|uniref:Uncharacterized protein n=1 Tax=Asparagus officinalis TaxID=4686 RepID=A0A5P1F8R8_ASPOF|nr:uncharacterized protein A4U43_C04F24830 [Asparagus officinalis]